MTARGELHERWMRRALAVAEASPGAVPGAAWAAGTRPEREQGIDLPVGAVVLDPEGRELSAARNAREALADPTAHAEILALREAATAHGDGWRLEGCTLVVTLEPCTMCAGAAVLARVGAIVFGAWEPKTGAAGSLWDVVRDPRLNHNPEVYGGILEAESATLLRGYFGR